MGEALYTGKTAVITGSTQGLGEAIARHLVEQGAAAMVICGRNRANGENVGKALEAAGCPTTRSAVPSPSRSPRGAIASTG